MKAYRVQKIKRFLAWGRFLMQRAPTVRKLLKAENCTREFFYMFKIGRAWYAIGHMEGGPFKKPTKHAINIKHRKILEDCLIPIEKKEVYDIKVSSL